MPILTIEVTEQDIEEGRRRCNWTCPICLALWRITGTKWVVDNDTCFPITRRNEFIPLPPEAVAFAREFDATGCGKPFSFPLDVRDKYEA